MLGRERREERRAERRGATRYTLREKMLSIGDDFWVEDSDGDKVFKVDGKALRIRKTLIIESRDGRELAKVQERMLHIKDSMSIEGPDGQEVALVKKALISPIRHRFEVKMAAGEDLSVHGNVVDHEYTIERDGHKVAEVSKRWFRVRDTYGIEVEPDENAAIVIAITICLDQMAHD